MHHHTEAYPLSPKASRRPTRQRFPDQVTMTLAQLSLKLIILLIDTFVKNRKNTFCTVKKNDKYTPTKQ